MNELLPKPVVIKEYTYKNRGTELYEALNDEDYTLLVLAGHQICSSCNGSRQCGGSGLCGEKRPHGCANCSGLGVVRD